MKILEFTDAEVGAAIKTLEKIQKYFAILDLSRMSGTGNGIGASTIAKLKAFAKEYGYL
jgi:hypothetical protein